MTDQTAKLFEELVELNYQLYNSLFLTLPLDAVEQTGTLLPLMAEACDSSQTQGDDPPQILGDIFEQHRDHFTQDVKVQFLYKIIQYLERQVVMVCA